MTEFNLQSHTRRLGPPISEDNAGVRLDEYLAAHFPFLSRSGWQREIDSGTVFVNDLRGRKPSQRLQLGDLVRRVSPIEEEPEVNTDLRMLWTDGHLAALSKPAGLPMHESGRYRLKTVAALQSKVLGAEWSYVHRLDRETSGLLIMGRTPEIRDALVQDWTAGRVRKTYLAVTRGIPPTPSWTVNLPIAHDRLDRRNRAFINAQGDHAITEFSTIGAKNGYALIEARPLTGRTNQIRVHLESQGLPLVGDKIYGADPQIFEWYRTEGNSPRVQELAGFPRHALHAWKIALIHPLTKKEFILECPLADDLAELCEKNGISTIN